MSERASCSRSPPWIELPSDLWAVIGSQLGTKDLARALTMVKDLCAVQPLALNLAHTSTENNKVGELVWGLKRGSRVLTAIIEIANGWCDYFFRCEEVLLPRRWSFPCIQELSLDVRTTAGRDRVSMCKANLFGWSLLAHMAQLQLLHLKARVLWQLPVMPRLRHLILVLDAGEMPVVLGNALVSLADRPALQSLHAEVVTTVNHDPHIWDLDLRTCASLQAVCLRGIIPKEVFLPPAAKLTLDISASVSRVPCNGLRLHGCRNLWGLTDAVDFSMLSALSLHNVDDGGDAVIQLGANACHLRFLLVTCRSENLCLILLLPCLPTLIVHAAECLRVVF